MDFPELLTGNTLKFRYDGDHSRPVAAIADRSDDYRNTVRKVTAVSTYY